MITITHLTYKNTHLININQLNHLLSQLTTNFTPHTQDSFIKFLSQPHLYQIGAFDNQTLVGLASLFIIQKIEIKTGLIEGVVVDKDYRNQGIGTKLMYHLITRAKKLNLHHIDLTSNPKRLAANKLYIKLGFFQRNTNVYRLVLVD